MNRSRKNPNQLKKSQLSWFRSKLKPRSQAKKLRKTNKSLSHKLMPRQKSQRLMRTKSKFKSHQPKMKRLMILLPSKLRQKLRPRD